MATIHDPRRRQRPVRTHRTSSAHARSVVLDRSGDARRTKTSTVAAPTSPDEIVPVEREAPKTPRPVRAPDADDHLAAYFRQLAEHELLTPEDERELSQGIEDTEILTWERVFARPEIVKAVLALVVLAEKILRNGDRFAQIVGVILVVAGVMHIAGKW